MKYAIKQVDMPQLFLGEIQAIVLTYVCVSYIFEYKFLE
jgi:hypothetical protein